MAVSYDLRQTGRGAGALWAPSTDEPDAPDPLLLAWAVAAHGRDPASMADPGAGVVDATDGTDELPIHVLLANAVRDHGKDKLASGAFDYDTATPRDGAPSGSPGAAPYARMAGGPSSGAATAARPGFWDYWGVQGCANCHGYTPSTLPPAGGHFPFPPNVAPRTGNPGGASPQPRRDFPQCEMQERRDRGICAQQPTEPTKAVCNASATERRVWCDDHDGEIGRPDLFTARRKSGRRWP